MAYTFSRIKRTPFLPESVQVFLKRKLVELTGFFFIWAGFLILFSLVTHTSSDPSFNSITPFENFNFFGEIGSYLSDLLLQGFGLYAYGFSPVLISWGVQISFFEKPSYFKSRFLALFFALVFFNIFSLTSMSHASSFAHFVLHTTLNSLLNGKFLLLQKLVFLTIGLCLYGWSLSLPKERWQKILSFFLSQVKRLFSSARTGLFKKSAEPHAPSFSAPIPTDPEEPFPKKELSPREILENKPISPIPLILSHTQDTDYTPPPLTLLQDDPLKKKPVQKQYLEEQSQKLATTLQDFGVNGEISHVRPGPVVTLYEFKPAPGMKASRIIGLSDDIARSMSAVSTRIANIPGHNALGIEIPNTSRETVFMKTVLCSEAYTHTQACLPLILGKNISGDPIIADLGKMPHLLVAGTTGSGKSVAINAMILSLLYKLSPKQCRFIMIDPKMLELSIYDDIPHLLTPVVTDPHKAVMALKWAVHEMENRYKLMSKLGVRNIEGYNEKIKNLKEKNETFHIQTQVGFDPETGKPVSESTPLDLTPLPFLVIVVDEMADLMLVAGKDIEGAVQRLAQMARAAGIHLIMATQRPSVDVITGTIKANFPTRISFQVTSKIDSRTILGEQGAEQLLGQGDMLYMSSGGRLSRIHGPFVKDSEVERIVNFIKTNSPANYETNLSLNSIESASGGSDSDDPLYDQALSLILAEKKVSTSFIQRYLQIGYNRAARIVEQMEKEGVISKPNHVGKREILKK